MFNTATDVFAQGIPGPLGLKPETVHWVYGPTEVDLGGHAVLSVPSGYRFASADQARTLMRLMNNPIPKALAGVIKPAGSDEWMIVFEYTETGYIPTRADAKLDAKSILKRLRKQVVAQQKEAGQDEALEVDWQMQPEYDPSTQRLEWAIVVKSPAGDVFNHFVRLLGRHGVLDGIAVFPARVPFEKVPLKDVMSNASFKPGHAYADYQLGDRVSDHGLSDLITAETENGGTISVPMMIAWAGGAV